MEKWFKFEEWKFLTEWERNKERNPIVTNTIQIQQNKDILERYKKEVEEFEKRINK